MPEDIVRPALQVSEPFGEIRGEEAFEQVLGEGLEVVRVPDLSGDDFLVELHRVAVFGEEGRVTGLERGDQEKEEGVSVRDLQDALNKLVFEALEG
jgi:hypothetical protein